MTYIKRWRFSQTQCRYMYSLWNEVSVPLLHYSSAFYTH